VNGRLSETAVTPRAWRDGLAWFALALLSRTYLVFLGTLAAIALLPGLLGWQATVVQTGSMEPGVSPGDVVLTCTLPDDADVPLGRVVSFDSPAEAEPDGVAKIRLHRIVDANDDGTFVTAGDANAEVDSTPIVREQIIGQARLLVPWVGLPAWWAGHGDLVALAVWAGLTLLALVVVGLDLPGGARGRREAGASGGSHTDAARHASSPESTDDAPGADVGRRAVLTGVGGLVVFGLIALPRQQSDAAFTAKTTTGGNTWSVAVTAPLTPGRAATYVLVASTSIVNQNSHFSTFVDGNIATSPGTTVSGFSFWAIDGSTDRNTTGAKNARTDALALAAAVDKRGSTGAFPQNLTGTIRPGVYTSTGAASTSGTITLDARGDTSAVFIFRASSITTGQGAVVRLVNGARAGNVYWRSTNAVSLGRDSTNLGTYIAGTSGVLNNGSSLTGRMFAFAGSITLDRATVQSF
jgi:signal peptidase I